MQLTFIRHGLTAGNLQGAYIGDTDEPLCPQGREALLARLESGCYPAPQAVVTSPLLRCRQTAELLYPGSVPLVLHGLRECSFGAFEGKTYRDLKSLPAYQAWLDSGGTEPPPKGESRPDFIGRCEASFLEAIKMLQRETVREASFIVHGGVIMALMERYALPRQSFYTWQVKNGNGFTARLEDPPLCLLEPKILWEEGAPRL